MHRSRRKCSLPGDQDYPSLCHQKSRIVSKKNTAFDAFLTYHVKIQERYAEAEVVLIEYPHKLIVEKLCTGIEPTSAPWIKGATLELQRISKFHSVSTPIFLPRR